MKRAIRLKASFTFYSNFLAEDSPIVYSIMVLPFTAVTVRVASFHEIDAPSSSKIARIGTRVDPSTTVGGTSKVIRFPSIKRV